MNYIVKEGGSISGNQKENLRYQANYYQKLLTANPDIEFPFVNNTDIKLSDKGKAKTNKPLSLEELTYPVKNIRKCQTPGCDGLAVEIYLMLWDQLGILLYKAQLFAYDNGQLHLSCEKGYYKLNS